MNYPKIYNRLIERSKGRDMRNVYTEQHHVVPRCMGGSDTKDNLAVLTAEEHFVAHQLLCKIHPENSKLWWALNAMSMSPGGNGQRNNNKLYAWHKRRVAKASSVLHKGKKNSPETRAKMSAARANRTDEQKALESSRKSASHKGLKHSAETKAKIGAANKGIQLFGEKNNNFRPITEEEVKAIKSIPNWDTLRPSAIRNRLKKRDIIMSVKRIERFQASLKEAQNKYSYEKTRYSAIERN